MNLQEELTGIETRSERYMGEDGRERADLFWDDYQRLLELVKSRMEVMPMTPDPNAAPTPETPLTSPETRIGAE